MKVRFAALFAALLMFAGTLASVGLSQSAAEATDPTPQQILVFKVAYNVTPLDATDQYVFYLMVRSVAPATLIPDSTITQAINQYNAGSPDLLKSLPTGQDSPADGTAATTATKSQTAATSAQIAAAGATALPNCQIITHYFGYTMNVYNIVHAKLFWMRYDTAWDTYCGVLITKVYYTRLTYSTTTLGNVTGWDWQGLQYDEHWYWNWSGYGTSAMHKAWGGNWKQCITLFVTVCVSNFFAKGHTDIYSDGYACVEGTAWSRRTCFAR